MGLIKNIFRGTSENHHSSDINWIILKDFSQLDDIVEASDKKPIAIFKYRNRCGLRRMVLKELERRHELIENEPGWYFLDLIKFREVSNEVSDRFKVRHESPQLIVIKGGEVVYHDSHSAIDINALKKTLFKENLRL